MTDSPLMELRRKVEADLKARFPGVIGVGFGVKETAGRTTRTPAFRIYVEKKRDAADLPAGEMLPKTCEGYPTDVLELDEWVFDHCEDIRQYARLIGGITITNFKQNSVGEYRMGTLGFFATIDGVDGPDNVVLVSNHHILGFANTQKGDSIYQPRGQENPNPDPTQPQTTLRFEQEFRRKVGKIHNVGQATNHRFSYDPAVTNDADKDDYFIDCASAQLDISISSTCNKSTGIDYQNEIHDLKLNPTAENPDGNSRIMRVGRVRPEDIAVNEDTSDTDPSNDYVVFKAGRRTGRTRGKVVEVYLPGTPGAPESGVFVVEALDPDCDGFDRFSAPSDSGAAIINAQNELIGLHFGRLVASPNRSIACHIGPVIDFLGIKPITAEDNPPIGPAGHARSDEPGRLMPIEAHVVALRERIEAHERAGPLYTGFMEHWDEIVMLVNHRRPLLVAWHRTKGPTFVAHLSESARKPGHRIPFEIDGVSRREVLERMADLLTEEGSSELRAFIAANREEALALIDRFDDLHSFVDDLETEKVDA